MDCRKLLGGLVCLLSFSAFGQESGQEPASREEVEGLRMIVDALRKIKFSGYVQAQYRWLEDDSVSAKYNAGLYSGGPFLGSSSNHFQVRRGRLKLTYDNDLSQAVLQMDVTQGGVAAIDAYVQVIEPWQRSLGLQAGMFNRPFGYEVSFSSSTRESPERARVTQVLFPGERDLGARLFFDTDHGTLAPLQFSLAVVNGVGRVATDIDSFKDIIGRVAYEIPLDEIGAAVDLGVSAYFGKNRSSTSVIYQIGSSSGVTGFVPDTSTSNVGLGVDKTYYGGDIQVYYDIAGLGGLTIRGEVVGGKQPGSSSSSNSLAAIPPGDLYLRNFFGWYAYLVQNIGSTLQVVLKYDVYDPNTDVDGDDFVSVSNLGVADIMMTTFGGGLVFHWDQHVKFTAYYELVQNENISSSSRSSLAPFREDVTDNVFTLRTQFKF